MAENSQKNINKLKKMDVINGKRNTSEFILLACKPYRTATLAGFYRKQNQIIELGEVAI